MRIVITSGPSFEPIDKVRRLGNFSTGELGTLLAEGFAEAKHSVTCFRAEGSTFAPPLYPVEVIPFTTNDDLTAKLQALPAREEVELVFHAAALCDFRVKQITDENGRTVPGHKMSSRTGTLNLQLEPAPKLIASLRRMFPSSILIGWKFELDGTRDNVLAKGRAQMDDCLTDACVLNGDAYGHGFGVISRSTEQVHLPDKPALCRFLIEWAERMPTALNAPARAEFPRAFEFYVALAVYLNATIRKVAGAGPAPERLRSVGRDR